MTQEVFGSYLALRAGHEPALEPVTPFSRFIEWLERQDREAALQYWSGYLADYEQQITLPQQKTQSKSLQSGEYVAEDLECNFQPELVAQIERVAKQNQVTINTLIQTVWGVLLQKYNNSTDVVFGSVVSGRPGDIPGVEHMIGLFINTIPVRVQSEQGETFVELMKRTQQQALASNAYDAFPLYEIQALTEQKQDLINHIMIFENYPVGQQVEQLGSEGQDKFTISNVVATEETNYDLNVAVMPGEGIKIRFMYNALSFDQAGIERLHGHLARLLEQISLNPHVRVEELELVTAAEKQQITGAFNATASAYPSHQTIQKLFEEQAERTPDHVAVVWEHQSLTYRELNERANRLARTLRTEGVESEQPVGILAQRSLDMIVGIYAILKAGGAYVPIDPEYPADRIRFMLEDSGAKLVLTSSHLAEQASLSFDGQVLVLERNDIYHEDSSNLEPLSGPHHVAYVIYTSGSTGKPKGVMVEHHSVLNRILWMHDRYGLSAEDTILQKTTFTFDVSVWELFWWSMVGSKVSLLSVGGEKNPEDIVDTIARDGVTTMHFVPAMLHAFLEYVEQQPREVMQAKLGTLRHVFASGEALPPQHVARFQRLVSSLAGAKLINLYGPTEATVDVSYFDCELDEEYTVIPIGKPIQNIRLYIVKEGKEQLQPIGVAGELCIGGVGVARGYLNRPELTAEKFVADPFAGGEAGYERMYRTGDLARWLPDGNIEYLGRIDHQVKIRGYRIELGEVETQLLQVESVREAVVMARADETGQNQMVAYYVAGQELSASELRSELGRELPSYMVPSYFVQLEQMPLSPNGKIDRKALPVPEGSLQSGAEYVEPRTGAERALVAIWQSVLNVQTVGILDNFFDLGGDSIKAIQFSSRLLQAGYKMDMKDLFKFPNVKELAPHLRLADKQTTEQGEVTGKVTLTPTQYWLAEQGQVHAYPFNQAVMLHLEQGFDESALRQALIKLTEHHDALRMVFSKTEQGYEAWNRGVHEGELYHLDVLNFRDITDEALLSATIEAKASEIQSSIYVHEGPLFKAGLFHCADGDHLLIAIHQLVADGVSWRILLEDLATVYEKAVHQEVLQLPDKTDSFRSWSQRLYNYANSAALEGERAYWEHLNASALADQVRLPEDQAQDGKFILADTGKMVVKLSEEETERLLKQAHRAYNTEVNDLLLTALSMMLYTWTGHERSLINLEGYEREGILPDTDLSRTIGCFTVQYPIWLNIGSDSTLSGRIKQVKESLRDIPNKGIGYGIWRYLSESGQATGQQADALNLGQHQAFAEPQVSLSYHGQFDQDLQNSDIRMSPYSIGSVVSDQVEMKYDFIVDAGVTNGILKLDIRYNSKVFRKDTIQMLANLLKANLLEVIEHCVAREQSELTPSDVLFKGLTLEQLDTIKEQTKTVGELENVYPLTPMQKGMLFHSLMNTQTEVYFEQLTFDLEGEFEPSMFEESVKLLVSRHAIFRTNFYSGWHGQPLQVVYRHKNASFRYEDARGREHTVAEFVTQDKARGFDLGKDALMRIAVFRTGDCSYRFVWSFHHILMDGWCLSLVMEEVLSAYSSLMKNRQPELPPVRPYSRYIEWLEQQKAQEAARYWSDYLAGYEQQTLLLGEKAQASVTVQNEDADGSDGRSETGYVLEKVTFGLGKERSTALKRIAKQQKVTINTILQSAWGVILQKYNNNQDVVFGSVVSGRPAEVAGVESMIGLFINTIPVRIYSERNATFAEILKRTQEQALSSGPYDTFPLYDIQALTEQKQDLINHIMVFENYPIGQKISQAIDSGEADAHTGLSIANVAIAEQTNYDFNLIVVPDEDITILLEYNELVYNRSEMQRIKGHIEHVIRQIVENPNIRVSELELITSEEQAQIIQVWGDTATAYPQDQTLSAVFEEQVAQTPDQVALMFGHQSLTYRELNERANSLARILQAQGVGPDKLVGLMVHRSVEMIVGLLAVLKAGGAYVPIDPEFPSSRIQYMLEDSEATVLLTSRDLLEEHHCNANAIFIEDAELYQGESSNLEAIARPEHLAYVIYTSGSTGNPKGVMLQHRSVLNFITGMREAIDFETSQTILSLTTISFDIFVLETILPLLGGMTVVLGDRQHQVNPQVLGELITHHHIEMLQMTPSRVQMLLGHETGSRALQSVKAIMVGGEALPSKLLGDLQKINGPRIYNMYGPTETTVWSTVQELTHAHQINIGRPIANTQIYIMNADGGLQPIGVPGELCIAGEGLARGYWKREELTAEKFVENPFAGGKAGYERMYRTGDLARWMPDGNIEYLGRIDHQVKIRGYRIELGEVESQLLQVESVREAVVVARMDEMGQNHMVAYYVAGQVVDASELRSELGRELPGYMVPSYFVQLEQLPLTPNGKIDRKALPAPEGSLQTGVDYAEPRTMQERALVAVWQSVLGLQTVGILDNFFDLGGDSIKAIQIASRAFQAGYKLDMKDLFQYPTVEALAPHMHEVRRMADQEEVSGETALLPIQHWFFAQERERPQHFNQAVMLYRAEGFEETAIRQAMDHLVKHHDALRMVFRQTSAGYTAWTRHVEEGTLYTLEMVDYRERAAYAEALEAKATEIQSSMDLSAGPLVKLGWFRTTEGDHLLIAIHHLVVDGVSWRILFEDFSTGYEQAIQGEPVRLPYKTDSFQTWARELSSYANRPEAASDEVYWKQLEQVKAEAAPLPKDFAYEGSVNADSEVLTVEWTEAETEQLLKQAHRAYNTEVNDLLLTALGLAVHNWTGAGHVLVNLEGHGREAILPEVDITRTVGWFTSLYPVLLETGKEMTLAQRIKETKEGLRRIPHKGLTYGTWRYLSSALPADEVGTIAAEPEISFNYLGQVDQDLQNSGITLSSYRAGETEDAHSRLAYTLDLNAMISEGTLRLTIAYSRKQYRKETLERVASLLQSALQEVIAHCVAQEHLELTPSDVSFKGLTTGELEQIAEQAARIGELENVYALTPMQKGMLFYNLMDSQSGAYFEQASFDLRGHFNIAAFAASLDVLVQRHTVLRTNFYSGWKDEPLQVVYRNKRSELYVEDLRDMEDEQQNEYMLEFTRKDKQRGFDLAQDALMRVAVLRTGEDAYRFVWSFHHIVMDGWCLSLVTNEVFASYFAILAHKQPELAPVTPYSQYIEWLEQQDRQAASSYWSKVLEGYEEQSRLPQAKIQGKTGYQAERLDFDLGAELTAGIQRIAKRYQVTINTLMQTVWGLLLQKYNGTDDVVFGSVVSGRPADIPNVEHIIGLFINTIPVRIRSQVDSVFSDVMKQTQEQSIASHVYDTYPLYEIQGLSELKQDLINHILIFENYPVEEQIEQLGSSEASSFTITGAESVEQTNYDFNVVVLPGNTIHMSFGYNALAFERESVEQIRGHLVQLLEQVIANPNIRVHELDMVTMQERKQIVEVWGNTAVAYPSKQTIHGLFEVQTAQTPEQTALFFEGEALTYHELNERANRLARTLRSQGVTKDRLVGLMTERSVDMIVGIFGILKAGGAYVPIDPTYPEERIRYMLDDSGAKLLLTQSHLMDKAVIDGQVLVLDGAQEVYHEDGSNLEPLSGPNDLAYVIYTSGTTGQPKGVMLEHHGLCNLKTYFDRTLKIRASDHALLFASYSFDAACWEIFQALFCGATLYVPTTETILNYERFEQYMADHHITVAALPPTYAVYLEPGRMPHLRILFTAGSASSTELVYKWKDQVAYYNGYGPTENSVATSIWPVSEDERAGQLISIGRPVPNHRVYMVDVHGHLAPVGVAGELYVSGPGLARGYLDRPELTAEKFVANPFAAGEAGYERMYRTGDLARWMPDGNIEYLGRIDHQVKIRGYRIELGEVEAQILKVEDVQEVIVLAQADEQGQNQLVAYYVAERDVSAGELRSFLGEELPNYMVPSYFIQLEQMPLTPNGKIDRKALPTPEGSLQSGADYVEPRTALEQTLASIWQSVLGTKNIGILDNFFDLGGDSIKAIQVSSRLLQAGYKLDMKDLFQYPSISLLSGHVHPVSRTADQGEVSGSVKLTPIQQWFFGLSSAEPHYFNQSVMLHRAEGFDIGALHRTVTQVTEHHDALRMVFRQTEQGYEAWNRGVNEGELYHLDVVDLTGVEDTADVMMAIEMKANAIQSSICLDEGPLVKLGLFRCMDGDHLLIAIHHLVIDGISWRIVFEDFATGYEQAVRGEAIRLPYKTDSFSAWAERLSQYANSPAIDNEREYWQRLAHMAVASLPKDQDKAAGQPFWVRDSETVTVAWNEQETRLLLQESHRAYNTEVNDLLLTALGSALYNWSGQKRVLVNLEGHGREAIVPDVDITRTVGWFTSQYPLLLDVDGKAEIGQRIKRVKEDLRHVPHKGIGYGILKYMSSDNADPSLNLQPEISFNYLGQFDQDLEQSDIVLSSHTDGEPMSGYTVLEQPLNVNGMIKAGVLTLEIRYDSQVYHQQNVEKFAQLLRESLQEVIKHCASQERSELTPSDVLFKGLSLEQLEQLTEQTASVGELENVYALSPMQKGMLFHSLMEPDSGAYFQQASFDQKGRFDVAVFRQSLDLLTQRHEALRTNFHRFETEHGQEPLQLVFRHKDSDLSFKDVRGMRKAEQQAYIQALKQEDQARGFDLGTDALMRVQVWQTDEETYHWVWSFHHIIMDGWCLSLVTGEVFGTYFALLEQKQPELAPITPYGQYIEWLERQDERAAKEYWSNYLAGFEQQTLLPGSDTASKDQVADSRDNTVSTTASTTSEYVCEKITVELDPTWSEAMYRIAKQQQVTINTLMQSVWGLILQQYNNNEDVVFGSVVSGRPTDIAGVENMIGLFINTIPVRIQSERNATFVDIMRNTQEKALASGVYDSFPLYEIQALTEQKQHLINHIMVFENYPVEEQVEQLGEVRPSAFDITNVEVVEQTNYDLDLIVMPDETFRIMFRYNANVYDRSTIERMQGHVLHVIEQIVNNPHIRVNELELVTPEEQAQIVQIWGDTAAPYPQDQTLSALFEQQAAITPDQAAVIFGSEMLTYRELNERANRLARTLRAQGVEPDQPVGILLHRSLDMIVGIYAILKAGGAYVPIDPEYPADRIRFMLEDSGAKLVLTQSHLAEQASRSFDGQVLVLDRQEQAGKNIYHEDGSNLEPLAGPHHVAYVIYTSGSTGKPKGVMVEHHSVLNRILWMHDRYGLSAEDTILQKTAFTFDVSVWELFWWSMVGSKVSLLSVGGEKNPEDIVDTIARDGVSTMHFVPAMLHAFLEYVEQQPREVMQAKLGTLRHVFASGEALPPQHVARFQRLVSSLTGAKLINLYGPTEATVDVSYFDCEPLEEYAVIPIGKPIQNIRLYIVKEGTEQLQPIGVAGELCIGGVGVARGYLNRPELTAEKFVADPFAGGEAGYERMYRTGDLARWMPDGDIEYLGRIDHQVKIRGYRIELGEVETQLLQVESVREAIVMARGDETGQKHMVAYYVAGQEISASELRSALGQELPSYMVPSYFVQLEQMPLSPNGKIDRKALPAPEGSLQSGADYVPPRTWVEVKLAQIWQDVLGLAQVGVKENFFEIGGHSLRATTLTSKIHQELNKQLPLRSIFEAPTIEQLAAVLEQLDQVAYASIPVTEERSFYPLSSAQKRLYVLHQFDPLDVNYNMPSVLQVSGPLDVKRVEHVFRQLIARHATLRTRFELVDNEPMQWIEDTVPFEVEYTKVQAEDATADTDQDTTTDTYTRVNIEAQQLVRRFVRPFDLKAAPLLRVGLVDLGLQGVEQESQHLLMLDMHHIVSDGVSLEVLTDEFVRLYGGEELAPLRIQYKDYAVWQQSEAHQEWMQRQEAYWLNTFRGELPVLDLSTDFARPAVQSTAGDTIEFVLEREVSERLKELAAQTGSTLYMVMLAAYTTLLHKYTGQEDIVVGTPIAGRPHAELSNLVGVFINTLAIRNYPSGDTSFLEYLQEVKEQALNAYEHQDYPFEELVEKLNVARDTSRNALFDTMFELKTMEQQEFELEGLSLSSYPLENHTAKFDLSLEAIEQPEGILCSLEYSTALYKRETMTRLAEHFAEIVRAIAYHPQQPLAVLNMVTDEEQEQLIYGFGEVGVTDVAVEAGTLFHTYVEEQAQLIPDHVAVVYEEQQLTYRKLNERANQLARRLRNEGIGRESIVGILSERSVDMLVGVLAVWKAGGAYVPLDADYPSERIRFMLEDSGATVLLTQIGLQEQAKAWLEESRQALAGGQTESELETAVSAETMERDSLNEGLSLKSDSKSDSEAASESATKLRLQIMLALDDESLYTGDTTDVDHINEPQDLAYVIYTSGTTGRPKGVMIEHRSLVNTAAAYRRDYRLSEFPVRLLQLASFSFDVFVGDMARTLYNGGTMVICPKDDRLDFSRLHGWIRDYQITVFESTPALIVPFMQHVHEQGLDMSSMELLITSSDSCSVTDYRVLQERFGADIRIMNSYGVTEAAIDSSFYDEELSKLPSSGHVPIGQAWLNARFYIVDSQLNPVPIGVLGELCIGGAGVARGYLNRADLTAEKFVANPYVPGERLYRTGDLARWMPDGNVDFIGRMDDQVKIRGFRIELGEVEAQLLTVDGIEKAIVTAWENENGDKDLCAYVVASEALNLPELRSTLQPKLPSYMIPTYVVPLDQFPLTPNGKIDRKALPAPEARLEGGTEYVAPRTPLEEQLVRIWQSVLNHQRVGIQDNFFEVGGHSLRATTLMAKIHQELNHKLALRDIFQYPTIEQLVQVMGEDQTQQTYVSIPVAEEREYYPVSSAQKRMYVLSHLEGGEVSYNMPGALIIEGSLDKKRLEQAFRQLIARHETLRTRFEMIDGEVIQRIESNVPFSVEYVQASEEETPQYAQDFVRAFDLAQAPLLRVQLIENGPGRHVMLYDMHHIISDGVTEGIIVQEFSQLYEGKELPPLRIQYKDYAVWQHADMQSERLRAQESYWLNTMSGEIPALDMPTDFT
ncbi:non-ribosomal peptide synthase/polyketide synthase, partial [Paenibacillus sp. AK121]